ncbi:acyl carrier protein [Candidatus Dependentiae bacterium]|nr:acyl carrier protein [Candidatus Dependentiae bacterium]
MDRSQIYAKVAAIIANILKINEDTVTLDSSLESLGADSLNRVEFVIELEDAFGIEINDEDAEKLATVGQIVDYIERLVSAKQS